MIFEAKELLVSKISDVEGDGLTFEIAAGNFFGGTQIENFTGFGDNFDVIGGTCFDIWVRNELVSFAVVG